MKTNKLIDDLVKKNKPVQPIYKPYIRTLIWLGVVVVCFAVGIILYGPRHDLSTAIMMPVFYLEAFVLLIGGLCSSFATFQLAQPCDTIRKRTLFLLAFASAILIISKSTCVYFAGLDGIWDYFTPTPGARIVSFNLLFIAVPAVALYLLLRRSAPVRLAWTGGTALMAIGSFTALGCKFICPIDAPGYFVVWHYMPIVILVAIGITTGRRLLRW